LIQFILGFLVSVSWLLESQVSAMPRYSIKEGKKCAYCHVDPDVGGPTNERGRYYGKHYSFIGYQETQKKNPQAKPQLQKVKPKAKSKAKAKPSSQSQESKSTIIEVQFDE